MAIRIITDTTADYTLEEAKNKNITLVPLQVVFQQESYKDRYEMNDGLFYELLETRDYPTTSQPSPIAFEEAFKEGIEAQDEIICITLASKLSGTYQSANIAKMTLGYDKIHIIDSETTTLPLNLLVEQALKLVEKGMSAEEIVDEVEKLKKRVRLYASLDTLQYLVKGGRLSKTAGFAGSLLHIKPIITVQNGEVKVVSKARGTKAAYKNLFSIMKSEGIDTNLGICTGFTKNKEAGEDFANYLSAYGVHIGSNRAIGSVIGVHAGPNACGIAYFVKG